MVWFYFHLHVSVDQWLNNCHSRNFKQLIFLFTILISLQSSSVLLFKLPFIRIVIFLCICDNPAFNYNYHFIYILTFYSDKCIAQVYKQYVSVMMLYKITKMCAKGFVSSPLKFVTICNPGSLVWVFFSSNSKRYHVNKYLHSN